MADILIRKVPDDDVRRVDRHAVQAGLSRGEYLRRKLAEDAARDGDPVQIAEFDQFANLADDKAMSGAWS